MPQITLEVPAAHREDLRGEAVRLYAVKTEALHIAVNDYIADRETSERVLAHRAELGAIDELIEQLGWQPEQRARRVTVSGDGELLAELLVGALHNAASELVQTVESRDRALMVAETPGTLARAKGLQTLLRGTQASAK